MPLFIRFLRLARNYRSRLGIALLLVFIGTALTLPMPKLTGNLIDASGVMEAARGSGANLTVARANAMQIALYTCVLMLVLA
ncbi:MAG: hypothetical protein WCP21_09965, partial [Armatimonadota bacterium]